MSDLVSLLIGIAWIAGAVIAKGFWSTAFAIVCPPWAWYLLVEHALIMMRWMAP